MAVAGRSRVPLLPQLKLEIEQAANSLAERDERGEIKLSSDGVRLVRAILGGGDYEGAANLLAERDERGAIRLSAEVAGLVRDILGPDSAAPGAVDKSGKVLIPHGSAERAAAALAAPAGSARPRGGKTVETRGEKGLFTGRRRL